ncbi:MAG: SPASM domain-containing protein, partial [Anaerolineae bacterium]
REVHDKIRGKAGTFASIISGLEALRTEKERAGATRPFVIISATVCQDNAGNLDDVFQVCQDVQADGMVAYYGYFQTEESCEHYESVMQEQLDTVPVSQRGWLWGHDQVDTEVLVETVKRIRSKHWPFFYVFAPDLTLEDIPRYFQDQYNTFGYKKCIAPWSMVEILPNGDVATCRDYPDYKVGNITEESLLDIWNNERYRRFRNHL